MFKTIIFDFFGVIRTDAYKTWLQKRGQVLEGGFLEANQKVDRGEIDTREFLARLSELTGEAPEAIFEDMEAAIKIDDDALSIISGLRANGYPIGLLSNSPSAFIRDIFKQHDLEKYFDTIVISSEVGMIKPEADIFRYILKKMGCPGNETIFIDDNKRNVSAAEGMGIHGILFTDAKTLENDLDRLGVRISSTR